MNHKKQKYFASIDLKSLIIGFLLSLCIMLFSGFTSVTNNGRYQCSATESWVAVMDTQTGHVWIMERSASIDFGTPRNRESFRKYVAPRGEE